MAKRKPHVNPYKLLALRPDWAATLRGPLLIGRGPLADGKAVYTAHWMIWGDLAIAGTALHKALLKQAKLQAAVEPGHWALRTDPWELDTDAAHCPKPDAVVPPSGVYVPLRMGVAEIRLPEGYDAGTWGTVEAEGATICLRANPVGAARRFDADKREMADEACSRNERNDDLTSHEEHQTVCVSETYWRVLAAAGLTLWIRSCEDDALGKSYAARTEAAAAAPLLISKDIEACGVLMPRRD